MQLHVCPISLSLLSCLKTSLCHKTSPGNQLIDFFFYDIDVWAQITYFWFIVPTSNNMHIIIISPLLLQRQHLNLQKKLESCICLQGCLCSLGLLHSTKNYHDMDVILVSYKDSSCSLYKQTTYIWLKSWASNLLFGFIWFSNICVWFQNDSDNK